MKRTISFCLLVLTSAAQASPEAQLELPRFDSTRVSERAELQHSERTAYEPKGSMPTVERTSSQRLELAYTQGGEGRLHVTKARRWIPKPRPRPAGPAAPRAPGAAPEREVLVEQPLPCEGRRILLRLKTPGGVMAEVAGAAAKVHPALGWDLRYPLESLLPKQKVTLGQTWNPELAKAAPALLGAEAWGRVAHLRVAGGALEAKLEEAREGAFVVALTLELTFTDPPEEPAPLHLDFAASLKASGKLTLGPTGVLLAVEGTLHVKRYYSSGAPPDAKIDATTRLKRDVERRPG